MYTAKLRNVDGSIMLTLPTPVLEKLQLGVGSKVGVAVEQGRLVVQKLADPRYTLDALIAQGDATLPATDEETFWLASNPVGRELI